MSIQIGAYEAKTKLPALLRKVKEGQSFTITHRGEAVADLVPSRLSKKHGTRSAIDALKVFTLAKPARHVDIKSLIGRGRR